MNEKRYYEVVYCFDTFTIQMERREERSMFIAFVCWSGCSVHFSILFSLLFACHLCHFYVRVVSCRLLPSIRISYPSCQWCKWKRKKQHRSEKEKRLLVLCEAYAFGDGAIFQCQNRYGLFHSKIPICTSNIQHWEHWEHWALHANWIPLFRCFVKNGLKCDGIHFFMRFQSFSSFPIHYVHCELWLGAF